LIVDKAEIKNELTFLHEEVLVLKYHQAHKPENDNPQGNLYLFHRVSFLRLHSIGLGFAGPWMVMVQRRSRSM